MGYFNNEETLLLFRIFQGSRGLMDRVLDLKPEVTQGCGFESRLWQEVSMTEVRPLSKPPNPQTAPRALQCRLPTAPLGWVKCREHISLLIILCIFVYVTNKAHLSLICCRRRCNSCIETSHMLYFSTDVVKVIDMQMRILVQGFQIYSVRSHGYPND